MTDVTFKINRRNIDKIMKSPRVRADLARRAKNVAAAAARPGGKYGPGKWNVYDEGGGHVRPRAAVVTGDYAARYNEAHSRSLTAAIDAGRRGIRAPRQSFRQRTTRN